MNLKLTTFLSASTRETNQLLFKYIRLSDRGTFKKMEGIGSRPVRSSSRFLPSTQSTFTGPVRKWKKKWVHVSQSPNTTFLKSRANQNPSSSSSSLLLCKWTTHNNNNNNSSSSPRKRKIRYTPIAALANQNKVLGKLENGEGDVYGNHDHHPSVASSVSKNDDHYAREMFNLSVIEPLESNGDLSAEENVKRSWLDLGLF